MHKKHTEPKTQEELDDIKLVRITLFVLMPGFGIIFGVIFGVLFVI